MDVRRAEYNYIIDVLNERKIILNRLREGLERLEQTADIQFKRIAQIQVDLDEVKNAWQKVNVPSPDRLTRIQTDLDEIKKAWEKLNRAPGRN